MSPSALHLAHTYAAGVQMRRHMWPDSAYTLAQACRQAPSARTEVAAIVEGDTISRISPALPLGTQVTCRQKRCQLCRHRIMDANFQKSFFSSLRKTLVTHGFRRISSVKYWFSGADIQCMFEIQKSRYSDLYYFNVYYLASGPDIDPKTISLGVVGHRLESLFPEHAYLIRGISFDTNHHEQEYADFLMLLDNQFLPRIRELAESMDLLKDMDIV